MKVSRTNSSAVIWLKQKLPSGEFVYVAIQKRVSFTREYKEVDTFDVKSWFICHFYLLVYFDKGNRTCAYVMFQTTQLSVLLLLIKKCSRESFYSRRKREYLDERDVQQQNIRSYRKTEKRMTQSEENNVSKGFDERANVEEDFDEFRYLFRALALRQSEWFPLTKG